MNTPKRISRKLDAFRTGKKDVEVMGNMALAKQRPVLRPGKKVKQ